MGKHKKDIAALSKGLVDDLAGQAPVAPEEEAGQPEAPFADAPVAPIEERGVEAVQAETPFADAPATAGEAADTGPGELMVSLPMGEAPEKLETIFLRVPAETKKALQGIAKRRKLSLNAFLAALLDDLAKKFGEAK